MPQVTHKSLWFRWERRRGGARERLDAAEGATTVREPLVEAGRQAVELLLRSIAEIRLPWPGTVWQPATGSGRRWPAERREARDV